MAPITKLLFLALFFALVFNAKGECTFKNIYVSQSETGNWAHGMPELSVSITNKCACVQKEVKINCTDFHSYKGVDPAMLSVSGDECLLKNGNPIAPYETVKFLYAWEPQFPFTPISSQVACS